MKIISDPKLDYIGTVSDSPQWSFPLHKHETICEVLLILNGKGKITINNEIHSVKKADLIVFNSHTLHEEFSCLDCPIDFIYCGIRSLKIEGLKENTILPESYNPKINMSSYFSMLEPLFWFIYEEFQKKEEAFEEICTEQLRTTIHLIHRIAFLNEQKNTEKPSISQLIKEFLDENYKEHLSLKDIAKEFNINPYYLSHLFLKAHHISPISYIHNRRIGEAKLLLLNTDKKVKEIAQLLGYSNENYFSHFFKNKTGKSPLNYKKIEQKRRIKT